MPYIVVTGVQGERKRTYLPWGTLLDVGVRAAARQHLERHVTSVEVLDDGCARVLFLAGPGVERARALRARLHAAIGAPC